MPLIIQCLIYAHCYNAELIGWLLYYFGSFIPEELKENAAWQVSYLYVYLYQHMTSRHFTVTGYCAIISGNYSTFVDVGDWCFIDLSYRRRRLCLRQCRWSRVKRLFAARRHHIDVTSCHQETAEDVTTRTCSRCDFFFSAWHCPSSLFRWK